MSGSKLELEKTYRAMIGRTIVRIDSGCFRTERATYFTSNPRIVFDDGTVLSFVVDETEIGEYGISPIYSGNQKVEKRR